MIEEDIKYCESLLDQGLCVEGLAAAKASYKHLQYDEARYTRALGERILGLIRKASTESAKDPAARRDKLAELIQETESFPQFEAGVDTLLEIGDFSTLISCRDWDVNLSQDGFMRGHADYIDTRLLQAV